MVPLKYLCNFKRTLKRLTWSESCVISSNTPKVQAATFPITDTKLTFQLLYVPVVTLSTQDYYNPKLLQQLKLCFKEQLTGTITN